MIAIEERSTKDGCGVCIQHEANRCWRVACALWLRAKRGPLLDRRLLVDTFSLRLPVLSDRFVEVVHVSLTIHLHLVRVVLPMRGPTIVSHHPHKQRK
ncbi:unnamed protein product [Caenorhabditis auriculariae]|uniref:Uncharacterized protein n=1 Tax=Caenorhabditis auriculariae TaxID=2777116 RepID=A0A8S1HY83_9PELO|nr:unnamed protein product [Caenorhabditis auriculariae]